MAATNPVLIADSFTRTEPAPERWPFHYAHGLAELVLGTDIFVTHDDPLPLGVHPVTVRTPTADHPALAFVWPGPAPGLLQGWVVLTLDVAGVAKACAEFNHAAHPQK